MWELSCSELAGAGKWRQQLNFERHEKDQKGHQESQQGRASGHESVSWGEPGQVLAVLAEGNTEVWMCYGGKQDLDVT